MNNRTPPSPEARLVYAIARARDAVARAGTTPWGASGRTPRALARRGYLRVLRPYMRRRGEVDTTLIDALRAAQAEVEALRAEVHRQEERAGDVARAAVATREFVDGLRKRLEVVGERARRAEGALALHRIEAATPSQGPIDAVICTVVSRATMGHAYALGHSVARVHPGTPVLAFVTDELLGSADLPFTPVTLDEVLGAQAGDWQRRHHGIALEYALTPTCMRHALRQSGGPVIFIKQESMVVGSLAPILDGLTGSAMALTPHLLTPPLGDDAAERTRDVLLAGTFNGGVVAAADTPATHGMLAWWEDRMRDECVKDVAHGRHFEQRWLDLLASTFPDVAILRTPGLNLGHWNIADHAIGGGPGRLTADGHDVSVVRFSGFDAHDPDVVTRYAPDRLAGGLGPITDYFAAFRQELVTSVAGTA